MPAAAGDSPLIDVFVGLGANLGDASAALKAAVHSLSALPLTSVRTVSSHYRTAPVDADGPDYVNAVAWLRTVLTAPELLGSINRIERLHGRERSYRNAPRTLDIDILLYGDATIATPTLTVPHARMHERAFVLVPLAEIAPDVQIGRLGSARELATRVAHQAIERLDD